MFADLKLADLAVLFEAVRSAEKASGAVQAEPPAPASGFTAMHVGKYVVIRSYASGVWCARLVEYDPVTRHALMDDARRLWYWGGAFTLSTVALKGVTSAKMPAPVNQVIVAQVEEIIPTSPEAAKILQGWAVHEG